MKLFRDKQLQLRVFAAACESILFYLGFLIANQIAGGSHINIIFFIITALCGLFINFLPYNNFSKDKDRLIIGFTGLALAVLSIGISAINSFHLFAMPVGFIALIFLYYRSYTSFISSILYVYTIESFYKSAVFLFAANMAAVFWSRNFSAVSQELIRYSVLYLVMALYMLSEVKNFRYVSKNENSRKTFFDTAATSLLIIAAIIMSVPEVFETITYPFIWAFKIIYSWIVQVILFALNPIAKGMNYLFDLIEKPEQPGTIKPDFGNMLGTPDKYSGSLNLSSPLVQLIGKALAFILMLIICGFAVYFLFKFINRVTKTVQEEDFTEDKEFILRGSGEKSSRFFSKLSDSMKKMADSIAFIFTADNREKLRSEYKIFVQKLHGKKIIEDYNYTAQDIFQLLLIKIPEQGNELARVTAIYEEVRYGIRCPEDEELRSFRKNLAEISKNLQ